MTTHGAKRSGRVRITEAARECGWLITEGPIACVYRRGPRVIRVLFQGPGGVSQARAWRESPHERGAVDVREAVGTGKAEWVIEQLSRMGDA